MLHAPYFCSEKVRSEKTEPLILESFEICFRWMNILLVGEMGWMLASEISLPTTPIDLFNCTIFTKSKKQNVGLPDLLICCTLISYYAANSPFLFGEKGWNRAPDLGIIGNRFR